jgi:hypothetical protein
MLHSNAARLSCLSNPAARTTSSAVVSLRVPAEAILPALCKRADAA